MYTRGMCEGRKAEDLSVERVCRMVSQQQSDFRGRPRKTNPVIFQTVFPSRVTRRFVKVS